MSTIFGSNGDRINKQGKTSFFDCLSGNHDRVFHEGSTSFGKNENMFTGGGVSSFGNHHIFGSGNVYECDGRQYTRVGNTLFGPDGKRWLGGDDMSDSDVRDIISHDR